MTTPKARVAIERFEGGALARIEGTIEADFSPVELTEVKGCLILDLDGVTRITSFGVREWIRVLNACTAESIYFQHAHAGMVSQFNLVVGFAGRGVLVSCTLPYICEECDTEFEEPLDLTDHHDVVLRGEPPAMKCPKCGADAEFDDNPSTYFSWLATQPAPVLSDVARRILRGEKSAPAEPFSVRKEVDGAVTGLWLRGVLDGKARFKRVVDGLEGHVVVACGGLQPADPAGVGKLVDLRGLPGARVHFARVRMDLLRSIPKERRSEMAESVVSLLWPMRCDVCNTDSTGEIVAPVDVAHDGVDDEVQIRARCERCRTPGSVKIKLAREVILKFFLAKRIPDEVSAYLRERPGDSPSTAVTVESSTSKSGSASGLMEKSQSRYRLLRPLGEGGMAEVFLAEHQGPEGFKKKVVLKRILPRLEKNEEFVKMFLQEARVAARINHPNVVQIFDLGRENGHHFMAMEYVRGWDLRTITNAIGYTTELFPVEIACRIAADMCAGLHAAHSYVDDEGHKAGIIHRDISPHNVLISSDGAVKITDFGISKVDDSSLKTKPGMIKGKIIYMAPEQIDGELGPVDAASDVFAAALVLHEMLTGRAVFRRENEFSAMRAVLQAPIPPVTEARQDVTHSLSAIVARALERDRSKRYQTAEELRLDLENELALSGRACTSAHLGRWLGTLVAQARRTGVMGPPDGATPTGITAEVEDDDDESVFEAGSPDDRATQQIPMDASILKKTLKGG